MSTGWRKPGVQGELGARDGGKLEYKENYEHGMEETKSTRRTRSTVWRKPGVQGELGAWDGGNLEYKEN